jgi:hypothetical protein
LAIPGSDFTSSTEVTQSTPTPDGTAAGLDIATLFEPVKVLLAMRKFSVPGLLPGPPSMVIVLPPTGSIEMTCWPAVSGLSVSLFFNAPEPPTFAQIEELPPALVEACISSADWANAKLPSAVPVLFCKSMFRVDPLSERKLMPVCTPVDPTPPTPAAVPPIFVLSVKVIKDSAWRCRLMKIEPPPIVLPEIVEFTVACGVSAPFIASDSERMASLVVLVIELLL